MTVEDASPRRVGILLGTDLEPERVAVNASMAEERGFDEIWSGEDPFCNGGMAWLGNALSATSTIPVGMGIFSAVVRHPALLAMEIATLERMHPGRVRPGVGLGHIPFLEQMDLMPKSMLRSVRQCVDALGQLLAGETVSMDADEFSMREISLSNPPAEPPPLYLGGWRRKMLQLGGETTSGVLLGSEVGGPAYVSWAREQAELGAARGSKGERTQVYAFVRLACGENSEDVKASARPLLGELLWSIARNRSAFEVYGIDDQLHEMSERGGATTVAREMPAEWVDDLFVLGDAGECARKIERLFDAGADAVILYPLDTAATEEQIRICADHVLPRLDSRRHRGEDREASYRG